MLTWNDGPQGNPLANARTYVLPTNEPLLPANQTAVPAGATFQLRERDSLDFSMDLTAWLCANAPGAVISQATWTVPSDSPATPTIVGQEFEPTGFCVVVISDNGSAVGSVFWLDLAVTLSATPLPSAPNLAIPPRTLTRRLYVQVVAG